MTRARGSTLVALCCLLAASACVTRQAVVTSSQMQGAAVSSGLWMREELYFGLDSPDGMISDSTWQNFVDLHIAARLPDGFTILESVGYYRDPRTGRTEREPSRVLIVYYREGQAQIARALNDLAALYRRLFNQQSVLRVTSQVRVTT